MSDCCGEDHSQSPALVAWADQFTAEFRELARKEYGNWLASTGTLLVLDEQTLVTVYDPILEAGGNAMLELLGRRGCLKREGED